MMETLGPQVGTGGRHAPREDCTMTVSDGIAPTSDPALAAVRVCRVSASGPAVQSDGGDLVLVGADVETGVVEVMLQGSCSSCAISSTTLQAGIDRILRDRLPWVTEVKGDVDDTMDLEESAALGRGAYVPKF